MGFYFVGCGIHVGLLFSSSSTFVFESSFSSGHHRRSRELVSSSWAYCEAWFRFMDLGLGSVHCMKKHFRRPKFDKITTKIIDDQACR